MNKSNMYSPESRYRHAHVAGAARRVPALFGDAGIDCTQELCVSPTVLIWLKRQEVEARAVKALAGAGPNASKT